MFHLEAISFCFIQDKNGEEQQNRPATLTNAEYRQLLCICNDLKGLNIMISKCYMKFLQIPDNGQQSKNWSLRFFLDINIDFKILNYQEYASMNSNSKSGFLSNSQFISLILSDYGGDHRPLAALLRKQILVSLKFKPKNQGIIQWRNPSKCVYLAPPG